MTTKQIFEYNGDIISVDLSNVKFCPGPCNDSMEESSPSIYTSQNNGVNNVKEIHCLEIGSSIIEAILLEYPIGIILSFARPNQLQQWLL